MADKPYHRLTWARRRHAGLLALTHSRSSLWLGTDHLLVIDTNGYTESYKRFYFQDIQAVSIRLTRRRLIWNWVLGVPTALCLVGWCGDLVVLSRYDFGDWLSAVLVTLLFAIPLLLNNLHGPTCACMLRTAVQTEELPSLCRLPKTRSVLNLLRPLIAQAQGQMAPEENSARLSASGEAAAAPDAPAAGEVSYVVDDPNLPPRIIS